MLVLYVIYFIEGSWEVKLPTIWRDGKAEVVRVREEKRRREKIREEKESKERRSRCAKMVEKSRFSDDLWLRRVEKWLAKAAGAEPAGQTRHDDCLPLWRKAHFEAKTYKTHQVRTTFGSGDVEKVRAVVARSTLGSQKCLKLTGTFGSWDFEKVHTVVAPLWRKAHVEVKVLKIDGLRALLGVQMSFCESGARGSAPCEKSAKREGCVAFPKTMAWDIWRGSAKMHVAWQAQYKRHVHQRC